MTWRWCYDSSLSGLCFQSLIIILLSTNGEINCFPAADWWPRLHSCQRALPALQDWHRVPGAHPVRLQHRREHQVWRQPAGDQHERRHLRRQEGPAPRLCHGAAWGTGDVLFSGRLRWGSSSPGFRKTGKHRRRSWLWERGWYKHTAGWMWEWGAGVQVSVMLQNVSHLTTRVFLEMPLKFQLRHST